MKEADLIDRARPFVSGDDVIAAGIFGLQDTVAGSAGGAVAVNAVAEVAHLDPAADLAGTIAGAIAAKHAVAAAEGLSVRMLVAVTADQVVVCDWATGSGPSEVLMTFDRASLEVSMKHFGLARIVTLDDHASGTRLRLSASTSALSPEAKGDKAVIAELTKGG